MPSPRVGMFADDSVLVQSGGVVFFVWEFSKECDNEMVVAVRVGENVLPPLKSPDARLDCVWGETPPPPHFK